MGREISIRELRNHTADVVASVRAGERVALTVNRMPVADIVPPAQARSPWIPSSTLRAIIAEAGADRQLLAEVADVRDALIEAP